MAESKKMIEMARRDAWIEKLEQIKPMKIEHLSAVFEIDFKYTPKREQNYWIIRIFYGKNRQRKYLALTDYGMRQLLRVIDNNMDKIPLKMKLRMVGKYAYTFEVVEE